MSLIAEQLFRYNKAILNYLRFVQHNLRALCTRITDFSLSYIRALVLFNSKKFIYNILFPAHLCGSLATVSPDSRLIVRFYMKKVRKSKK